MPACGGFNASVGFVRDDGAEGLWIVCMSETPDVFNLALRERSRLLNIDEGRKRLDARGDGGFDGG